MNLLSKLHRPILALFAFSFFFKENINSFFFILFLVLTLYTLWSAKDIEALKKSMYGAIPLLIYFILAFLGLLINKDSNTGYFLRLIPLVTATFLIYYFSNDRLELKHFLLPFILGNIVFLFFLDFLAVWDMVDAQSLYVVHEGREYYRFLYVRLTADYFNHIYLSTYCVFSIVVILQFALVKKPYLKAIAIVYLLLHIGLLGSRSVVIAIMVGGFVYLLFLALQRRAYLKYFLLLFTVYAFGFGIVFLNKDSLLFNRYSQAFEWFEKREVILERNYSVNNRAKLYIIGLSMFHDQERYGINGTGIAPQAIQEQYENSFAQDFEFKTITYNTHNQFINNFIDWGILGLLLTIYIIYLPVKRAYSRELNWIAFFWVTFGIVLLMENVLIRHRGIVFFIIAFTMLFHYKKPLQND